MHAYMEVCIYLCEQARAHMHVGCQASMLAGIHVPVAPARVKFVLADLWLIIRPLVGTLAQAKTHARVRMNVRQRYRYVRARTTQRKAPRAARGQLRRGI
jgi:hypothetical protein